MGNTKCALNKPTNHKSDAKINRVYQSSSKQYFNSSYFIFLLQISGKLVAIKKIKKIEGKENKTYNEVKILQNLKHVSIAFYWKISLFYL